MRIGIISDTHGYLDPGLLTQLKICDEIWHGGDIGPGAVMEELISSHPGKTLRAVFGNIDGDDVQSQVPEDLTFEIEGVRVLITHIAGRPPRYNTRVRSLIESFKPMVLVCGHSHILKIMHDREHNLTYINPGACGNQGFHKFKTAVRLEILGGSVRNAEVINLGRRGAIKKPLK